MEKNINLIECTNKTANPTLIRMNCLMLAVQNEKAYNVIDCADEYFFWVLNLDAESIKRYNKRKPEETTDRKD